MKYRGGYYYAMYGADIVSRFRPKYRATAPANPLFARREPSFAEFVDYLLETPVERYDEHWRPVSGHIILLMMIILKGYKNAK